MGRRRREERRVHSEENVQVHVYTSYIQLHHNNPIPMDCSLTTLPLKPHPSL